MLPRPSPSYDPYAHMELAHRLRSWRRRPPLNVVIAFWASRASHHAAGLAFNAFLSIFLLGLGLIDVIGLFPQSDEIKAGVEKVLVVAFPSSEQAAILKNLQHAKTSAGTLALVSLLALLWSGTNLFASMEFALSQIYLCATRPFWRTRLMGVAMLGVVAVAVGVSLAVSTATATPPERPVAGFPAGWLLITALLLFILHL